MLLYLSKLTYQMSVNNSIIVTSTCLHAASDCVSKKKNTMDTECKKMIIMIANLPVNLVWSQLKRRAGGLILKVIFSLISRMRLQIIRIILLFLLVFVFKASSNQAGHDDRE